MHKSQGLLICTVCVLQATNNLAVDHNMTCIPASLLLWIEFKWLNLMCTSMTSLLRPKYIEPHAWIKYFRGSGCCHLHCQNEPADKTAQDTQGTVLTT